MLFTRKLSKNVLIIVFTLLSIGISAAGYFYYKNFEETRRIGIEQELTAIADLKVGEIVQWRKERLGDGALFHKNYNFSVRLSNFLERPDDEERKNRLVNWLFKIHSVFQYDRVSIIDLRGIERISIPDTPEPLDEHIIKDAVGTLRSGKVAFLDFHRNTPDTPIYLAVLVPIYDEINNHNPIGVLVLRINPEKYLYPLIKRWPGQSETAETLLVRREGDYAMFLNELRFKKNTALTYRIPLTNTKLPAVHAALGKEGIQEGYDYHGVPVIASLKAIPNSPWFLVARMDLSEVYAPIREQLWVTIVLVMALLAGAGGAVGFIWNQQTTSLYMEQIRIAEEKKRARRDNACWMII